jgi:hypothetical protein
MDMSLDMVRVYVLWNTRTGDKGLPIALKHELPGVE